MALKYPQSDIDAVKERASIVALVEQLTPLRNAGGGKLKGLCLFHDERSPSMVVHPGENYFHCFGCGAGGDVIKLSMELNSFTFSEAMQALASQFSITVEAQDDDSSEIVSLPTRIYDANRHAALFFKEALLTGEDPLGRDFLQDRQFEPAESAERFGLGYAPNTRRALVNHLLKLKFTKEEIIEAGLASEHKGSLYDVFQGRPVWAIKDGSNRVLGFGARKVRDDDRRDGKYINTPETPVYKKSKVLYGMDQARRQMAKLKQAIVVEGYTDVMSMHLAGLTNTVATCGTALTEDHLSMLRRVVSEDGEIIFCFDGDAAGIKAAMNSYTIGKKTTRRLSVLEIPGGKDPDSLRISEGLESLQALVPARRPLIEAVIRGTVAAAPLDTPEGRVIALDKVAAQLADVGDPLLRGQYAPLVAELVGLPESAVAKKLKVQIQERQGQAAAPQNVQSRSFERDALQLIIQHPDLPVSIALMNPAFYYSKYAQGLFPILSWWLAGQDHSMRSLLEATPTEYSVPLRELSMEVFDVTDLDMYGQELLKRLTISQIDRDIAEFKAYTADHPEDAEAFRNLRALRHERAALHN